jgi:hypothetical protein
MASRLTIPTFLLAFEPRPDYKRLFFANHCINETAEGFGSMR